MIQTKQLMYLCRGMNALKHASIKLEDRVLSLIVFRAASNISVQT